MEESPENAVPPTDIIEFLGVTFNSTKGTMEVSLDKMVEIHELVG